MAKAVAPFFTAEHGSVIAAGWLLQRDGEWIELPDALPDWDYNTELRLANTLSADDPRLRRSTRLGDEVPLCWSVTATTKDLRLSRSLHRSPYIAGEPAWIDVTLEGSLIGSVVELRSTLCRMASSPLTGPGVAHLGGSVLWQDHRSMALVGDLARFPVHVTDFALYGLDPDASYALEVPDDLTLPVLGSLLLLINERDLDLVRDASSGANGLLSLSMQEFVGATLLDAGVARAEELEADEWEAETVGHMLRLLGSRSPEGLRGLAAARERRPTEYQTLLVGEARRNGLGRRLP